MLDGARDVTGYHKQLEGEEAWKEGVRIGAPKALPKERYTLNGTRDINSNYMAANS